MCLSPDALVYVVLYVCIQSLVGTCYGVNFMWVLVRVWVHVQVHVGVLRVCLLLMIMAHFFEDTFRFRDL